MAGCALVDTCGADGAYHRCVVVVYCVGSETTMITRADRERWRMELPEDWQQAALREEALLAALGAADALREALTGQLDSCSLCGCQACANARPALARYDAAVEQP